MLKSASLILALGLLAVAGCGDDSGSTGPTGTLEITTATTGDPGADYTLLVDGGSPRTIAANATLSIPEIGADPHLIQLTLPTNCSIQGDNPRTVGVTEGATTTVAFAVTCSAG